MSRTTFPFTRSLRAASALTVLAAAPFAAADFSHVGIEDVSAALGTPAGFTTWRITAHFTDATDRCLGVSGSDDTPTRFHTSHPAGLFNDAGKLSGFPQEDFPTAPFGAPWDSWVTVGGDVAFAEPVVFTPGFEGTGKGVPIVTGQSFGDPLGGWHHNGGTFGVAGTECLLAQFTLPAGAAFELSSEVDWFDDGVLMHHPFYVALGCPRSEPVERIEFACSDRDLDGSGAVDFEDLLVVLSSWGDGAANVELQSFERTVYSRLQDCTFDCPINDAVRIEGRGAGSSVMQHDTIPGSVTASVDGALHLQDGMLRIDGGVAASVDLNCHQFHIRFFTRSDVRAVFEVAAPTDFALATETNGSPTIARLTGPGGVTYTQTGTVGTLEPGTWTLETVARLDLDSSDSGGVASAAVSVVLDDHGNRADADADGSVGFSDLVALLAAWGPCE